MKHRVIAFFSDQSGTAAIEYALIASGIFIAIIVVIGQVGNELLGIYEELAERMAEQQGA